MTIELSTPAPTLLNSVLDALREWQRDDMPLLLHPGDLGWAWRTGAERMASALRVWTRNKRIVAIGYLDEPDVLRLAVDPEADDENSALRIVADIANPGAGVLPAGAVSVEAPDGCRVRELLDDSGWTTGLAWSPFRLGLAHPIEPTALSIDVVQPGTESDFINVHRSAWDSERLTSELWQTMADGAPFVDGRCLLGRDERGVPVAGVTVWSAGRGRPGLIEPMGVHADHRRLGYGVMICREAAAELQRMGSSSVEVCTLSSLTGAVATYRAAGFIPMTERLDRTRSA